MNNPESSLITVNVLLSPPIDWNAPVAFADLPLLPATEPRAIGRYVVSHVGADGYAGVFDTQDNDRVCDWSGCTFWLTEYAELLVTALERVRNDDIEADRIVVKWTGESWEVRWIDPAYGGNLPPTTRQPTA